MSADHATHLQDDERDADAMRRCAAGDIAGLDDLVARHQIAALAIAYLLVQDPSASEDIVQESFPRALADRRWSVELHPAARVAQEETPSATSARVVRRGCRRLQRKQRLRPLAIS